MAKLIGIILYMIALVAIGAIASRRMGDVRDYFAAGKKLNFLAAAFSARATGESAWLLLGMTGMGAAVGVKAFWVVLGEILGVGAAWLLMGKRFKRLTDRYDSITVPDYLESRFRDPGHLLRLVSASALVVFVTIYVSAQIDATGTAFNSFLGWNYFIGALVGFAVVMVYIVSGGFLAVVWSDVFQGALMFLGLVSLPIVGLIIAGGWGPVAEGLRAQDPGLLSPAGPGEWTSTSIFGIISLALIGLGFLGSPQIFVRFLAMRSENEFSRGSFVAITWTILADVGAVLTGMVGRHLLMSDVDSGTPFTDVLGAGGQDVLPLLSEELLPAILVGLFIAIVLSAIMSTVDSLLVVASSAFVRDYYQKTKHPTMRDDQLIQMSRRATFILALLALLVALVVAVSTPNRTIFWFVIFGWSGIAATFCPTMILSLFWDGITARGALLAMITGFLSVPFFKFVAPNFPGVGPAFGALEELPPSFAVGLLVGVVASLLDRKGRERLRGIEDDMAAARGASPP